MSTYTDGAGRLGAESGAYFSNLSSMYSDMGSGCSLLGFWVQFTKADQDTLAYDVVVVVVVLV